MKQSLISRGTSRCVFIIVLLINRHLGCRWIIQCLCRVNLVSVCLQECEARGVCVNDEVKRLRACVANAAADLRSLKMQHTDTQTQMSKLQQQHYNDCQVHKHTGSESITLFAMSDIISMLLLTHSTVMIVFRRNWRSSTRCISVCSPDVCWWRRRTACWVPSRGWSLAQWCRSTWTDWPLTSPQPIRRWVEANGKDFHRCCAQVCVTVVCFRCHV